MVYHFVFMVFYIFFFSCVGTVKTTYWLSFYYYFPFFFVCVFNYNNFFFSQKNKKKISNLRLNHFGFDCKAHLRDTLRFPILCVRFFDALIYVPFMWITLPIIYSNNQELKLQKWKCCTQISIIIFIFCVVFFFFSWMSFSA